MAYKPMYKYQGNTSDNKNNRLMKKLKSLQEHINILKTFVIKTVPNG
jgi:hypothetical protein